MNEEPPPVIAPPSGSRLSQVEPEGERIFCILAAWPEISMYGLCDALAAEGVKVHATTVQRFLKSHGLDRKTRLARRRRKRGAGK